MVSLNARKRRGTSKIKTYKKEDANIDFHGGGTHGESSSDDGDYDDNYNKKRTRQKRISNGGDENVSSNDDWSDEGSDSDNDQSSDEREETIEEKKIRLAKEYLNQVSAKIDDDDGDTSSSSDEEDDEYDSNDGTSRLGHKLAKERLKRQGSYLSATAKKVFCSIVDMYTSIGIINEHTGKNVMKDDDDDIDVIMNKYSLPTTFSSDHLKQFEKSDYMTQLRGHDLTPTCISLHQSGSIAYSGSKDNSLLSWDVEYGKKISTILPHWNKTNMEHTKNYGEILALANSDDGRYLAVGGRNSMVKVFDVRSIGKGSSPSASLVSTFEGHKGAVTGLAFRKHSLDLFSSSNDRCIRYVCLMRFFFLYSNFLELSNKVIYHILFNPLAITI